MWSPDAMTTVDAEEISTDRLDLLPLRVDHADEMAVALSDPDLHIFIGGAPASPDELRSRYERMLAGPEEAGRSWCNWVIRLREDDCLVGTVQATITPEREAEIAWVVGVPWQGRGIATEAADALVAWLSRQRVGSVIAHVHPRHAASGAVARSVGLTPTTEVHDGEILWRSKFGK